jgi:hypothetical protein
MQAILVISTTFNYKQLKEFCEQFYGSNINVYIYNTTFTIMQKRELESTNISFIPKSFVKDNIEISLLKFAMQNDNNTHFHLMNEYSFIYPNNNVFNLFFDDNKSNYISLNSPYQWSITLEAATYVIKHYKNEEHIIDILKNCEILDIVDENLRFTSSSPLSVINLKEYISQGILTKFIIHDIDCNQIGYNQIMKQLKYIYSAFKK